MAETQGNTPLLHRKEWEPRALLPIATAANMFFIFDDNSLSNFGFYVTSTTAQYVYHFDEDDFVPVTSGALATFGVGACGVYHPWTPTYTANGGSTTTATVALSTHNIVGSVVGEHIEFLSGTSANIGLRRKIIAIDNSGVAGSTIILTFETPVSASVTTADTFRISVGSYFVYGGGVTAAGSFKRFDLGTMTWSGNLSVVGVPTFTVDGSMSTFARTDGATTLNYDTGTATSLTTTVLTHASKTWTAGQWVGYQLRIISGTGYNQPSRVITASTANTITVAAGTAGDATSVYAIEGNNNVIYLLGNGAVALYKYTIDTKPGETANTWATVAPAVARAAITGLGTTNDTLGKSGDTRWANVNDIRDGRYIYSLRGGGSAVLDRYDLPTNSWSVITNPSAVTFTTGCASTIDGRYLYIMKEGTAAIPNRFYKFSIRGDYMEPLTTDNYLGGAAVAGRKIAIKYLSTTGNIKWLYYLQSTSLIMRRIMIF